MQERRERVRAMLCRYHLSQAWLMYELEKTGVSVDKSSLSDMLGGRRKSGDKTARVIDNALVILEKYGKCYAGEETSHLGI